MTEIRITRTLQVPDPIAISRYQKVPEFGPKLLFFSGGSALYQFSRELKNYTHNSIHLVTPFDSGGSSAKLRQAFNMPAIGDLRNRLLALADETVLGQQEIFQLFTYRLPLGCSQQQLHQRLLDLAEGRDNLIKEISAPMRRLICHQLSFFLQNMPDDFDLSGASIGNLILAGGYLNNNHQLDSIIFLFSKLVNVQGTVRAIVDENLHLGVTLADGSQVIGQHLMTGKEVAPLSQPIDSLFLSKSLHTFEPAKVRLPNRNKALIDEADLICYPPGSFYSSLLVNLIPDGVAQAIAENNCVKVYVPNLGQDPEQLNMTLEQSLHRLLLQLQGAACPANRVVNCVLLDSKRGNYPGGIPHALLHEMDIQLIDTCLIDPEQPYLYDNKLLAAALLSLS